MKQSGYDGGISLERKLELVRKIRQEHQMNQNTVRGREAFLYGNAYEPSYHTAERGGMLPAEETVYSFSAWKMRMTAALLLFAVFYSAFSNQESLFGISVSQIYEAVEEDYSANLFAFMNEIPYTLHE